MITVVFNNLRGEVISIFDENRSIWRMPGYSDRIEQFHGHRETMDLKEFLEFGLSKTAQFSHLSKSWRRDDHRFDEAKTS